MSQLGIERKVRFVNAWGGEFPYCGSYHEALGYLSSWAAHSYPSAEIFHFRNGDLQACYYRGGTDGKPDYMIFAQLDQEAGTYSFHS